MDRQQFQGWLGDYVEAWTTYDADRIGALFSEDVVYWMQNNDFRKRTRDELVRRAKAGEI